MNWVNYVTFALIIATAVIQYFTWRLNKKTRDMIEETKKVNERLRGM